MPEHHRAEHHRPGHHRTAIRALGLAALAGATLSAPAATASSYVPESTPAPLTAHELGATVGAVPLYPLAGGPLDLLSNNVRVPFGGGTLSTEPVTAPLHDGLPLREVPVVGSLLP